MLLLLTDRWNSLLETIKTKMSLLVTSNISKTFNQLIIIVLLLFIFSVDLLLFVTLLPPSHFILNKLPSNHSPNIFLIYIFIVICICLLIHVLSSVYEYVFVKYDSITTPWYDLLTSFHVSCTATVLTDKITCWYIRNVCSLEIKWILS